MIKKEKECKNCERLKQENVFLREQLKQIAEEFTKLEQRFENGLQKVVRDMTESLTNNHEKNHE